MILQSIVLGDNRPEFINDETIASLFRKSALKNGSKTALIFNNQKLTYAELDRWSDAMAEFLASRGIGRGNSVIVWHKRGLALHAAILGIAKSGAAYVPMDREMPEDRVLAVMAEVKASACISEDKLEIDCPIFNVIAQPSVDVHIVAPDGPKPDDNAYLLYTSGSTGKPKGIPINHRQIGHLIQSEQSVLEINENDIVYQGFSVSFDMWCEETWISLYAGATLWVADETTAKSIDEISDILKENKVTILHAVPSLLAVMEDDIPTLRIINAGGETCPIQVMERWSKPSNVFYNSYGPTETTVTTTMVPLSPGDRITIGNPIPNYNLAVMDEKFNIVPFGTQGELVITGPGVCNGYIELPELTKEKFIAKPSALTELPGAVIYRTGDAVVIQEDGTVDFHGRIDNQVKLRGYRIELGEIEAKLNDLPNVTSAAVTIQKDNNDQGQLVGYVVLEKYSVFDEAFARAELTKSLPVYMVPIIVEVLKEMPRLSSGKINRKVLPIPKALLQMEKEESVVLSETDSVEHRVTTMLKKMFPSKTINQETDFFTDLGGHSLLAATFVSRLRKEAFLSQVSLRDVYTYRTVSKLVSVWEEKEALKSKTKQHQKPEFTKTSSIKFWTCGAAQGISLLVILGLFAIQIFVPYLGYYYVVARTPSGTGHFTFAIITALLLFCLIPPFYSFLSIAAKWIILGRIKEGDYPVWGAYYFRYWLVNSLQQLAPLQFLNGTPLYPFYLRMLGMKISADVQLGAITIGAADLVSIGRDASLSSQVVLDNVFIEDGFLKVRRIDIGDHAYIGSSAVIAGGAKIEDWGELQDLSFLQNGQTIKEREVWKGSPAIRMNVKTMDELPIPEYPTSTKRKTYGFLYTILLTIFPFVILLPLLPVIMILNRLDLAASDYNFDYLIYTPLLTIFYLFVYSLETVALSRLLQIGLKPGSYSVYSWNYVRKWLSDQLISLSLIVLHPIFATVFVSAFFRLLGAKVGKNTEISTASSVSHTFLEIGSESFVADAVTLGESDVRAQRLILNKTTIGDKSFVGNSALIPQGYNLPGDMLIGVLSVPPMVEQLTPNHAKDWFGSPAVALPHRQSSGDYPASLTTHPSWQRKLARGTVEGLRIILPETVIFCCSVLFIAYAHDLVKDRNIWEIMEEMPKLPFYYLFFMGVPAFLCSLLLKWVLVGKYKEEQKPMWTNKVWRSEAVTITYEALAVPYLLEFLQGTPFLPLLLKLFGVKMGKRVILNTTDITEQDMVSIGDDTVLNTDCGPQTHLFEDRVMKIGKVKIGARCSIGARTIILYDTEIGSDVNLDPLSLVMKGENLQSDTTWGGSPISPM